MTRRSPLNKRYQNEQRSGSNETGGSTRKSAASAKIKRESSSSKSKKSATRREKLMASARTGQSKQASKKGAPVMPDSEEYKKWRRIWWGLIAIALVTLVPALIMNGTKLSGKPPWSIVSVVLTAIAIIFVIATWVIDFKKIRPLVKQAQREAQSSKKN
jgi:hypothetical protein